MAQAVGGRGATGIASAGQRKAPGGVEGSASLTLPFEGWCGIQGQFPFHFNAASHPAYYWGCISSVGPVISFILKTQLFPRLSRVPGTHPRCSTKSLWTKGEESHGLGSVKSCLRSEGKSGASALSSYRRAVPGCPLVPGL